MKWNKKTFIDNFNAIYKIIPKVYIWYGEISVPDFKQFLNVSYQNQIFIKLKIKDVCHFIILILVNIVQ